MQLTPEENFVHEHNVKVELLTSHNIHFPLSQRSPSIHKEVFLLLFCFLIVIFFYFIITPISIIQFSSSWKKTTKVRNIRKTVF